MITLFVNDGKECRSLTFGEQVVTIGRSARNDIVIPGNRVSRQHALIRKNESEYHLVDMGSGNGTRVNSEKVALRTLFRGDEIRIGEVAIAVVALDTYPNSARSPTALPAAMDGFSRRNDAIPGESTAVLEAVTTRIVPARPRVGVLVSRVARKFCASSNGWLEKFLEKFSSWATSLIILGCCLYGAWMTYRGFASSLQPQPISSNRRLPKAEHPSAQPPVEPADAALADLRQRIRRTELISDELVSETAAWSDRYRDGHPSGPNPFDGLLQDLRDRRAGQIAEGLLERVADGVEIALREGRYKDALQAARLLGSRDPSLPPDPILERITSEIARDFTVVDQAGRRLEAEGQFRRAADHYRSHSVRFEGTDFHATLLQSAERAARECLRGADGGPPKGASVPPGMRG